MSEVIVPQGVLSPPADWPAIARLNAAGGVAHTADLEWPLFDPERTMTFADYVTAVGGTIAAAPRESSTSDSALQLFRADFNQAHPGGLKKGVTFPNARAVKSVVKVSGLLEERERTSYPGTLPTSTGLAVAEDVYEEIVKNPPYYANQIDNRTQRKQRSKVNMELAADLGGESVVYAFADKHELMEDRDRYFLDENAALLAIHKSIVRDTEHRIGGMEAYRLRGLTAIIEVARVACKQLGYGTNQTQATLRAVCSNMHRAPDAADWWGSYIGMTMWYHTEVRGKIAQSIQGCVEQIGVHRQQLISLEDREYSDD